MKLGPYQVSMSPRALIVPAICVGFGLYHYVDVRQLPDRKINLILIEPVFMLMIVFTIWVIAREIKIKHRKDVEKVRVDSALKVNRPLLQLSSTKKVGGFVLLTGLYLWLIQIVGFIICNIAFLITFMLFLGVRRWILLATIPLSATAVVYFLFAVWMQTPLPKGFLYFLP